MAVYAHLLERVEPLCALLGADERPHAERVIALCRELATRPRNDGKLVASARDVELKRELGRLTELLGRRASKALPAATLGRAALADLSGDGVSARLASEDCAAKLGMLGY